MCKEVELSSEAWASVSSSSEFSSNALQRLPERFWSVFAEKLMSTFGNDIFEGDADYGAAEGFLAVDFLTGTCGWNAAIVKACKQTRCEWFYYWYDMLPWYESDKFDCDILAELKKRLEK